MANPKEENAYILGTDAEELYRLGLQHQVWATEAHLGWKNAGFREGYKVLDLGCGPGFCSRELAYTVGQKGEVTAIDLSEAYIHYAEKINATEGLKINYIPTDFNTYDFPQDYFNGMYCRWALAWLDNPKEILGKVLDSLATGGKMVIHEYYDWSSLQTMPSRPGLDHAIGIALKSMKQNGADIDVGRYVPQWMEELGMKNIKLRKMTKLVTPHSNDWQWPKTFFFSYFPRLIEMGLLSKEESDQALKDMLEIEQSLIANIWTPLMVEVVGEKG